MNAIQMAERIVHQWDNHDKHRLAGGENALFSNGIEPDEVAISRRLLRLNALMVRIYNTGYQSGHQDTVEGVYFDILDRDKDTYHQDVVEVLIGELIT
jgi:hypothetical protein